MSLNTSNILLVFASSGDLIFTFLQTISAATAFEESRLKQMMLDKRFHDGTFLSMGEYEVLQRCRFFFATYFIDIAQIASQTYLLTVFSNPQFRWNLNNTVTGTRLKVVFFCLQFLGISNLINWMNASFLEFGLFQNNPWDVIIYTFDVWTALTQVTLPVAYFFRFHSVMTLLEIYIDYSTDEQREPLIRRVSL